MTIVFLADGNSTQTSKRYLLKTIVTNYTAVEIIGE